MFAKEFNHTFGKKQIRLPTHGIGNLAGVDRIKDYSFIKRPIIWVLL